MNEPHDLLAEVRRWVEKADNDLLNATCVITLADKCPTDTVCFHCQQCAEKYLKALLLARAASFPRTHDLVVLLNLAASSGGIMLRVEQVQPLNQYAIEARYPGNWEPIDLQEANEALNMAEGIRDAVRMLLPREALPENR